MSETATRQLVNALNDPEEPLTPEVEEAAKGVSGVIKNVLKSSSGVNQALGSTSSKVCFVCADRVPELDQPLL